MEKAKVFEETYTNYLEQLRHIDIIERAGRLGGKVVAGAIELPFFNTPYVVSHSGIEGGDGTVPTFAVKVVLCKYVLMCPDQSKTIATKLVTYREFKDASPLVSYFANNTNKTIEVSFSGNVGNLLEKCRLAGGIEKHSDSYDLSVTFLSLPNIPITLNFNDADDLFPAKASILYQSDAEVYLDMECLAITGTYLTGLLLKDS